MDIAVNKPKPMRRIRCIMDVTPRSELMNLPDGRSNPPSGIILTYNLESFQSNFKERIPAKLHHEGPPRDERKLAAPTTVDKRGDAALGDRRRRCRAEGGVESGDVTGDGHACDQPTGRIGSDEDCAPTKWGSQSTTYQGPTGTSDIPTR